MKKNIILLIVLLAVMALVSFVKYQNTPEISSIPARPDYSSGETCEWKWEGGVSIGFWREQCQFSTGLWTVAEIDSDTYGLFIEDESGSELYDPVIDVFTKRSDSPVESIIEDMTLLGLIPEGAECKFELTDMFETHDQFQLVPFGETKVLFEEQNSVEVPDEFCGPYGIGQADRHFNVYHSHPEKVIYVSNGQDGSFFDENTIQVY